MVVLNVGQNVSGFVENPVLFHAERNFPFGVPPENRFHRMVVIAVKKQIDARDGLRLFPLKGQRRIFIFRRGKKGQSFEGGVRVPFIASWPNRIKPGVCEEIVSLMDLTGAMAALTGQSLKDDEAVDSFNILPELLGEIATPARDYLVLEGMPVGHGDRPALVSEEGGPCEIVRSHNSGLVVDMCCPVALAEALRRVRHDDVLRDELRVGALARAKDSRWETVLAQL